jgi:putative FmdB family regulatory protein
MPTYEYECDACGHAFEDFQSITSKPTRKCPKCAKLKLRRLIGSGSAVIFKGSGFYQTDYRSKEYKAEAKADTAASSPSKAEASKTEAPKPSAKPSAAAASRDSGGQ